MNDGKRKKVRIKWYDAYSIDSWKPLDVILEATEEPMLCNTVGYILQDTSEAITICHSFNEENQVCGVIQIPKCSIQGKIEKLK